MLYQSGVKTVNLSLQNTARYLREPTAPKDFALPAPAQIQVASTTTNVVYTAFTEQAEDAMHRCSSVSPAGSMRFSSNHSGHVIDPVPAAVPRLTAFGR